MSAKHRECAALEADLVASATGEGTAEARVRVEAHTAACAPCRREFGRYRAIDRLVGELRATSVVAAEPLVREGLVARLADLRRGRMSYGVFPSPLGALLIARTPDGVSLVEYLGHEGDVRASTLGRLALDAREDAAAVETFYRELMDYLAGGRTRLDWPIDLRLTRSEFHRGVLRATAAIPYGAVCSYAGIASEIGTPTGARAVAQALRRNPLPIVVPCHRVVGASGALVGYAGDKIELKRRLLAVEGIAAGPARIRPAAMYVTRLRAHFYCLPTCDWIPQEAHPRRFVWFGSRERAEATGLTPCEDCRPDLHPIAS